ncbi:hypothetical protein PG987_013105 [Apiospora arundinis]
MSNQQSTTRAQRVHAPSILFPDQSGKNDMPSTATKRACSYDWRRNLRAVLARAAAAEIEEIPTSEVGRVVEGKKITNLYNVDEDGATYFFAYDGNDVLARVPELYIKETIIVELATLYLGLKNNCAHPDDIELQTNWQRTKGGDWVIHVHPKSGSNTKRARV